MCFWYVCFGPQEELGTEYLAQPVVHAEGQEDASDFEAGEETDDDIGDADGTRGNGGGHSRRDEMSSKRKRTARDDSDDDDDDDGDDDDDDERPPKR